MFALPESEFVIQGTATSACGTCSVSPPVRLSLQLVPHCGLRPRSCLGDAWLPALPFWRAEHHGTNAQPGPRSARLALLTYANVLIAV